MSARRVTKICADCGKTFYVPPADDWKTVCRFCWREEMSARVELQLLKAQLLNQPRLGGPRGLDLKRWRQLLQLCHPDRHGGSAAATEATRWLLEIRAEVGR